MTNPLFDKLFGKHAGKDTPFLYLSDNKVLSHDDFLKTAARFANAIRSLGLAAGDRLAVQIDKSPEALAVYAACVQSGVVFLPLNVGYTADEIDYFIGNSGAKLVLCSSANKQALMTVADAHDARLETLDGDGSGSFTVIAHDQPNDFETVERNGDDLAAFLYTSGTTGRSKGAMLTQDNLLSNALTLVEYWQFTPNDVLLHALPIFHTH